MKKFVLITLAAFLFASSNAQKIKVKKGEIFVDDINYGSFSKDKNLVSGGTYCIKDLSGKVVVSMNLVSKKSILELDDLVYNFYLLNFPETGQKAALKEHEFYGAGYENYFVKFFIEGKLVDKNGINREGLKAFMQQHPDSIPGDVIEKLKSEELQMEDMAVVVERDKTKELKLFSMKPEVIKTSTGDYRQQKYRIYQDKVLIGYVDYQTQAMANGVQKVGADKIFIYNSHNVAIGRLFISTFGNIRMYPLNQEIGYTRHNFNKTVYPDSERKMIDLANFFITKNIL